MRHPNRKVLEKKVRQKTETYLEHDGLWLGDERISPELAPCDYLRLDDVLLLADQGLCLILLLEKR